MDITPANLAGLHTAFTTAFNERLTGLETSYGMVAITVPSTTSENVYPRLDDIPAMRRWLGSREINSLTETGFVIRNEKFENTISVGVDKIEDDQYGVYTPMVAELGQTAAELPDELVWEVVASGFTAEGHDGQAFYDAEHPVEDENGETILVSNLTAGAGEPWFLVDTSRMIKPFIFQDRRAARLVAKTSLTDDNVFHQDEFVWGTDRRCAAGFGAWQLIHASQAALTAENYAAARAAMLGMKGPKGRKLSLRPTHLIVPPALEGAAREVLLAERDAAGATNVWRNTAELHVERRLAP
ncbi:MAG: Mu-like prophage major head subunit gpT family protein [Pseudomonadota bacterium]